MTFVIAGSCVSDYSCVEVCPADSIHPTADEPDFMTAEQLYIDPTTCVDCAACMEACPVGAVSDAAHLAPRVAQNLGLVNAEYYEFAGRRG